MVLRGAIYKKAIIITEYHTLRFEVLYACKRFRHLIACLRIPCWCKLRHSRQQVGARERYKRQSPCIFAPSPAQNFRRARAVSFARTAESRLFVGGRCVSSACMRALAVVNRVLHDGGAAVMPSCWSAHCGWLRFDALPAGQRNHAPSHAPALTLEQPPTKYMAVQPAESCPMHAIMRPVISGKDRHDSSDQQLL